MGVGAALILPIRLLYYSVIESKVLIANYNVFEMTMQHVFHILMIRQQVSEYVDGFNGTASTAMNAV